MRIDKRSLNASPFIGVFGILTDSILLVPNGIQAKEEKGLAELAGVELVKASIAASPLLGVLGLGVGDKIALSEIALPEEVESLEQAGLKVRVVKGVTALGNLACIAEKGGVISPILSREQALALEDFFGVKLVVSRVAGLDLAGSSLVATKKGFIAHPQTTPQELEKFKEAFGVQGILTTANYGDRFVGNSVIANTQSVLVGKNTTAHEIIRIEEAFYG